MVFELTFNIVLKLKPMSNLFVVPNDEVEVRRLILGVRSDGATGWVRLGTSGDWTVL